MKKLLVASLLFGFCLASTAAEDLILGFRNKSKYQLVVPDADAHADAIATDSAAQAAGF